MLAIEKRLWLTLVQRRVTHSFDTILNSNNASMYVKDTINGSSGNIYETLTLCGSESDLILGSVSGRANVNENDSSSNVNALK